MNGGSMTPPDDDPLGPVVESFLDRFRRGERPAADRADGPPPRAGRSDPRVDPGAGRAGAARRARPTAFHHCRGTAPARAIPAKGARRHERLGDYLILRRIGGGGMGVVYEAEHVSLRTGSRSRSCSRDSGPTRNTCGGSTPRPAWRPGCTTRISSASSTTASTTGSATTPCSSSRASPSTVSLADIRRLRDDDTHAGSLAAAADAILTIPAGESLASAAEGLLTGRFAAPTDPDLTTTAGTAAGEEAPAADAIEPRADHDAERPRGARPVVSRRRSDRRR